MNSLYYTRWYKGDHGYIRLAVGCLLKEMFKLSGLRLMLDPTGVRKFARLNVNDLAIDTGIKALFPFPSCLLLCKSGAICY